MCKLYGGALVSDHQTNQSSLKIQENQNEIHEPNSTKKQNVQGQKIRSRFVNPGLEHLLL